MFLDLRSECDAYSKAPLHKIFLGILTGLPYRIRVEKLEDVEESNIPYGIIVLY